MNSQRGPEEANPSKVAPSGGHLCVVRGGQEEAIQNVALSVETPVNTAEITEEANLASPHARARETASTGEEGDDGAFREF